MESRLVTPFTRLLGIDAPIVQAPIGGASTPELAAAVSNAGALGSLSITWREPSALPDLLRRVRGLTERPVAVNLVLAWDPAERLAIALAEGFRIVSLFWGDPAPWVAPVHVAGGLVLQTVGSAAEAERAVAAGVDVVVAQGWEAGGHVWGEVATMALVPRVVDAVDGVPVLAAGGITDGRGLAAALALGASGVWMGTRFVTAAESAAHPVWRERLLAASETDTRRGTLFDGGWEGAALRSLRNETVAAWEAAGRPPHGARPGEGETIATGEDGRPIPRYDNDAPLIGASGDVGAMCLYAGQGVGLVRRVQPAAEIVRDVVAEGEAATRRWRVAGDVRA
ncbi:MAG TPA: nitronate monooxygenase [Thermomicrobiales bacterium]|nr:nitronate monooxygenase [Thermomicrobiales bacterium]